MGPKLNFNWNKYIYVNSICHSFTKPEQGYRICQSRKEKNEEDLKIKKIQHFSKFLKFFPED